jgi:hypothetical protein
MRKRRERAERRRHAAAVAVVDASKSARESRKPPGPAGSSVDPACRQPDRRTDGRGKGEIGAVFALDAPDAALPRIDAKQLVGGIVDFAITLQVDRSGSSRPVERPAKRGKATEILLHQPAATETVGDLVTNHPIGA